MADQADSGELLTQFQAKVDEFAKFQDFIAKAEAQASRFAPEVVEKVITANREKSMSVVEALIPLTADVEDRVSTLEAEKTSIHEATQGADLAMQELELRKAIGEIEDDDFDKESESLRAELDGAKEKISGIDEELETLKGALERWTALGLEAGVLAEPEPEPEPEPESDDEDEDEGTGDEAEEGDESDGAEDGEEDDSDDEDDEVHDFDEDDDVLSLDEDPLAGLDLEVDDDDEDSPPTIQVMPADGGVLDEDDLVVTNDVDDIVEILVDDEDSDDIPLEDVDVDVGRGEGVHSASVKIQEDLSSVLESAEDQDTKHEEVLIPDDVLPGDEDGLDIIHPDEPLQMDEADGGGELKPRRAVLLYAEGTPEEQVHPVTKDMVSIGRGRDNDIQVRNDSKVSRYHCKIYRRGPNYYIEDNKSANGSLVNGELITERRLFGGEEIIIGETFFRFRILD